MRQIIFYIITLVVLSLSKVGFAYDKLDVYGWVFGINSDEFLNCISLKIEEDSTQNIQFIFDRDKNIKVRFVPSKFDSQKLDSLPIDQRPNLIKCFEKLNTLQYMNKFLKQCNPDSTIDSLSYDSKNLDFTGISYAIGLGDYQMKDIWAMQDSSLINVIVAHYADFMFGKSQTYSFRYIDDLPLLLNDKEQNILKKYKCHISGSGKLEESLLEEYGAYFKLYNERCRNDEFKPFEYLLELDKKFNKDSIQSKPYRTQIKHELKANRVIGDDFAFLNETLKLGQDSLTKRIQYRLYNEFDNTVSDYSILKLFEKELKGLNTPIYLVVKDNQIKRFSEKEYYAVFQNKSDNDESKSSFESWCRINLNLLIGALVVVFLLTAFFFYKLIFRKRKKGVDQTEEKQSTSGTESEGVSSHNTILKLIEESKLVDEEKENAVSYLNNLATGKDQVAIENAQGRQKVDKKDSYKLFVNALEEALKKDDDFSVEIQKSFNAINPKKGKEKNADVWVNAISNNRWLEKNRKWKEWIDKNQSESPDSVSERLKLLKNVKNELNAKTKDDINKGLKNILSNSSKWIELRKTKINSNNYLEFVNVLIQKAGYNDEEQKTISEYLNDLFNSKVMLDSKEKPDSRLKDTNLYSRFNTNPEDYKESSTRLSKIYSGNKRFEFLSDNFKGISSRIDGILNSFWNGNNFEKMNDKDKTRCFLMFTALLYSYNILLNQGLCNGQIDSEIDLLNLKLLTGSDANSINQLLEDIHKKHIEDLRSKTDPPTDPRFEVYKSYLKEFYPLPFFIFGKYFEN